MACAEAKRMRRSAHDIKTSKMEDRVTEHQEALHAEYVAMRTQLTPNIKALFANSFAGAAKCFRSSESKEESTRCSDMLLKKIITVLP
jgi:hypothetical protein